MTDSKLSNPTAIRINTDQHVRVIGTDDDGAGLECRLSVAITSDAYEAGREMADWLDSNGLGSSNLSLLLPSCEFVVHSTIDPILRRLDNKTLLFDLEPELPFDLESAVVDISRLKDSILILALPVDPWREFLRGLENGGANIGAIYPSAYVEALEIARVEKVQTADMLFTMDGCYEYIRIRDGQVAEWQTVPTNESGTPPESQLRMLPLARASKFIVGEIPQSDTEFLESMHVEYRESTSTKSLCEIVSTGSRTDSSLPDFRKEELCGATHSEQLQRPLNLLVGSIVILIIAINSGLFLRGKQLAERVSNDEATITNSYKGAFPERRVPAGVLKRLKSEQTKLRRETGTDIQLEETQSALHSLIQLIDGIPQKPRVLVTRLGSEPMQVELEGYVQHPSDWQSVVEQLREQNLVIDQPDERTDETGTTWFKLTGQIIGQGGSDGS